MPSELYGKNKQAAQMPNGNVSRHQLKKWLTLITLSLEKVTQMSNDNPYSDQHGGMPQLPPGGYPPPHKQSVSALDAFIPTNPLAAISCWSGIISALICVTGPVLGPIAILTGILALKKWKANESTYGAATSTARAWIGIVSGTIGLILGSITVMMMVASIFA